MKTWLLKFRISNALNDRQALPPQLEQALSVCDGARCFAEEAKALDQRLKAELPEAEVPASLHAAIMRSVRKEVHSSVVEFQPAWPRWVAPAGIGMMAALVLIFGTQFFPKLRRSAEPRASNAYLAASSTLELGNTLMLRDAPAAAMAPLADEMARLDLDLDRTKEFLLASLP